MKTFNIYTEEDIDKDIVKSILEDDDVWDYPFEELDYLISNTTNTNWLLKQGRLYEIDDYIFTDIPKPLSNIKRGEE